MVQSVDNQRAIALPTQLVVVPDAPHGFFHTHHAEAGITAVLAHMQTVSPWPDISAG